MKSLARYQTFFEYVFNFSIRTPLTFWKYAVFHPARVFFADNCFTVYFFKTIDSLTHVSNFLFREFYLSLLIKFKIGLSLGFTCLMSSMFIIMWIIMRIIKTSCFGKIILMAWLEDKVGVLFFSHNFPNSGYFHKIFCMHFQKDLLYFSTKTFLTQLLYFWNYNPSPNGQIFPYRSSRPEVFCKKDVLRISTKFTGKHLCQGLFFNKVTGLSPRTLLKKMFWHRCFPADFAKFLGRPFITEPIWWLILSLIDAQVNL